MLKVNALLNKMHVLEILTFCLGKIDKLYET